MTDIKTILHTHTCTHKLNERISWKPAFMSTLITQAWPSMAAHISGVMRFTSRHSISAPRDTCCSSQLTQLQCFQSDMDETANTNQWEVIKTYSPCTVKEMLSVQHRQTTRLTSDSQIEALPHIAAMAKGVVWSLSTAFTWQLAALISICVHNRIFPVSLSHAAKMPTLIFPAYLHPTRSLTELRRDIRHTSLHVT